VRRRRLGAELRRLREAAGLTGDQVIARIGWASASKLSRLENGRSRPDLGDVLDLLDLYAVTGPTRDDLIAITRDAGNSRGWLRSYPVMTARQRGYAELEAGSSEILEYGPSILPGLLQTPGYTRTRLLSSRPLLAGDESESEGEDPETEIAARVARQSLLTREVDPPRYEAVLDEATLTGRGGPPAVLGTQLHHLSHLTTLPNVTLRVLAPRSPIGDWYLPETAFSIYRFADPDDPDTVAVEALAADMVLAEEAILARYVRVFEWLREAARSPEESATWIAEAATASGPAAPEPARPVPPAQRRRRTLPRTS
jgi:transcriptional regulator with XRE-family HTH domain